ncbi:hypothetical protein CKO44_14230 [Rubrivivax gelatinosus]|uniref:STAS domain-containing protein n=1 Tax=Rubrivivax gelatinosus TaxID=28068 RepID=A0ABS1DWA9_RUBGE|nr:STAS domain-containing protein [Rubrivivax gelatinosus]MBK1614628.1 hypothetical protein [Rubrivivax gelatinosus]MBK1714041.1 hypothetical protein [Rubrivivax gelatinosus]
MKLPATATLAQAPELLRQLGDNTEVIDASDLTEFDTSAVALLLEARRRAAAGGRTLRVDGAPRKLVELSLLYGVDELLGFTPAAQPG